MSQANENQNTAPNVQDKRKPAPRSAAEECPNVGSDRPDDSDDADALGVLGKAKGAEVVAKD